MALIPIAISPHGHTSSLWNRHMYGTSAMPCPDFDPTRINAPAAYKLACSPKVPSGVLDRADTLWRADHPDTSYSGSYRAMTPRIWFDQELGLITSSAIASHILRTYNKNRTTTNTQSLISETFTPAYQFNDMDAPVVDCHDDCTSVCSSGCSAHSAPAVSPHS